MRSGIDSVSGQRTSIQVVQKARIDADGVRRDTAGLLFIKQACCYALDQTIRSRTHFIELFEEL
jgi:hypothetical protein